MIRAGQNQVQKVKSMEDAQRTYSPDDEFGDLYVGLGVDGTKSKEECMNLVETIKGLQKYVQAIRLIMKGL
jgi:hypothetical protein